MELKVQRQTGTSIIINGFAGFTVGEGYPYEANPVVCLLERLLCTQRFQKRIKEVSEVAAKATHAFNKMGKSSQKAVAAQQKIINRIDRITKELSL